ncbi:sugar nucleotide-binding protein, partial [Candidatus Pelagibacter sp.]|nr:sugar nucleotide-binding protein [Candidatus Pelagibacter sp.]
EENPQMAYLINGYLPYFLYLSCRKVKAKFIHFSSECVFEGKVFKKKYSESSKTKPSTILGKSKRQSEILLAKANFTIIIRLPMLFGPRQKKHLIYKMLKNLKKNKKTFASTDILSTPVYVPSLVKFIREKLIENEKFFKLKKKNNLINFSSNEYISIYNFIKLFAKELKKEKYIFPVKDKYFDKNSEKPKYLGLKSLKKYSTNDTLHTCVKNYLQIIY